MANFFGDLFNSFTGQKSAPTYNPLDPTTGLNQAYGIAESQVPNYSNLNKALQPVDTGLQLANENQIYGPAANNLRQGTYQSILDELNLGTSLPADLQDRVVRQALEGNAASGFGVGNGGRGLVAADLGLTGLDLGRARRAEALGATNLLPTSHYTYSPVGRSTVEPSGIYNQLQQQNAISNEFQNQAEQVRQQNFTNLLNTGTKLIGMGAGAFFGGPIGAQIGGEIGSHVIGGPDQGIGSSGSGGLSSFLKGLFSPSAGGTQAGEPYSMLSEGAMLA